MGTDFAGKYAGQFLSMPDRFKEIYMKYLYSKIIEQDGKLRIFVDCIGLPTECESPIEQILWLALNIYSLETENHYVFLEQSEVNANGNNYRVDFLYCEDYMDDIKNPFYLAIECDGHEFHEKTKQQVDRRNKRDMDLKMEGIDVLHFSGSKIYKEPFSCAEEICNYIAKKIEERKNE